MSGWARRGDCKGRVSGAGLTVVDKAIRLVTVERIVNAFILFQSDLEHCSLDSECLGFCAVECLDPSVLDRRRAQYIYSPSHSD